jgi:hypothetical protein
VPILRTFFEPEKSLRIAALSGCDISSQEEASNKGEALNQYLQEYGLSLGFGLLLIGCRLALDAIIVSSTGLSKESSSTESVFAFLMHALDHRLPELLKTSARYKNGKINEEI